MLHNYYSVNTIKTLLGKTDTLMVLPYGSACAPSSTGIIASGLSSLGHSVNEVWSIANTKISRGTSGRCQWSKSAEILCVATWITPDQCQNLAEATQLAYQDLLTLLDQFDYQHPFRFWNYLPNINAGDNDEEQYKKFCMGRLNAFKTKGVQPNEFPAASALGHHSGGAVIYVIANRFPSTHHKNALQLDAYEYPHEYGISSPSFSRATSITISTKPLFFISGTASIIGHKTQHANNLEKQVQTTIGNIQYLLEHANNHALPLQSMKVYLRHAKDYSVAKKLLEKTFLSVPMLFTHADICRADLLMEIECFCS
ncbi:hypothetical protein JYU13_00520 [Gammaproteobacteria bacterium AH-315-M22]|nr:hypothetical protein [Gammaproteobacteria bacterium AH-315-M22]